MVGLLYFVSSSRTGLSKRRYTAGGTTSTSSTGQPVSKTVPPPENKASTQSQATKCSERTITGTNSNIAGVGSKSTGLTGNSQHSAPFSCGSSAAPTVSAADWIATLPTPQRLVEEEWQHKLTIEAFRVLRMRGTEEIHTGCYNDHFEAG